MNRSEQEIEVTMTSKDIYARFEALEEEVAHCYFVFHGFEPVLWDGLPFRYEPAVHAISGFDPLPR